MTRRTFAGVLVVAGCSTRQELPPAPLPPRSFTSAGGVRWTVRDGRTVIPEGERPLPVAVVRRLEIADVAEAGVLTPAAVTLSVVAYRQTIVEPGSQRPAGTLGSVFNDASYAKSNALKSGDGPTAALFQIGVLGLLEMLNIGLFVGRTAATVVDKATETADEPGITCDLTATAELTWADGRTKTVPLTARGWAVRESGEKDYRAAAQAAQDQLSGDVWRGLWQAIRSGP
jgi:hypothetical protein